MATRYFVAPGHYGDRARVSSSHATLAASLRQATPGWAAYEGDKRKGDEWLRVYEQHYTRVDVGRVG